jgi:hypothetical protein
MQVESYVVVNFMRIQILRSKTIMLVMCVYMYMSVEFEINYFLTLEAIKSDMILTQLPCR